MPLVQVLSPPKSNTTHNFASGGNDFKIALYTGSIASVYTTASTVVSSTNEVSTGGGSNYSRQALSSQAVASSTAVASVDFGDSTWASATFTAAFAAIYNDTAAGDPLVVVLDFGGDKTCTNGTFKITYPDPTTPANAIISMS